MFNDYNVIMKYTVRYRTLESLFAHAEDSLLWQKYFMNIYRYFINTINMECTNIILHNYAKLIAEVEFISDIRFACVCVCVCVYAEIENKP